MRTIYIVAVLIALCVLPAGAQDEEAVPTEKYKVVTNTFWQNWFVQAGMTGTAFYTNEEHGLSLSKSPFKDFRSNLGFSVGLGKWFTPGIGLRTKFTGVWGRTVLSDDKKTNANKYWTLHEQVLLNFSNLFCGYNESRVWNLIPYVGVGVSRNMTYNEYAMGMSAGLLNTFRLCRRVLINVDISYGYHESNYSGYSSYDYAVDMDKNTSKHNDQTLTFEVGLTYNLGSTNWTKSPDIDAIHELAQGEIDALNAQLADAQAENARLRGLAGGSAPSKTETVTVKEVVSTPVSVFFNIGQSEIASEKDLLDVQELADYAKSSGAGIVVTGYADSVTGNADGNRELSKKRAEEVAGKIAAMGVDKDKIEVVVAGGVDALSPEDYNRRVTVEIKK